jgi:hypothetical protein
MTLGHSREPPVAHILWPNRAVEQTSRDCEMTRKSGSPPSVGNKHAPSTCRLFRGRGRRRERERRREDEYETGINTSNPNPIGVETPSNPRFVTSALPIYHACQTTN